MVTLIGRAEKVLEYMVIYCYIKALAVFCSLLQFCGTSVALGNGADER
jgi:hypothetical protein